MVDHYTPVKYGSCMAKIYTEVTDEEKYMGAAGKGI